MPEYGRYASNTDWEPLRFFSDCLFNSLNFDLCLGYFSSSAIRVLSCGFASFLHRGGVMRMTVNDVLIPEDVEAIKKAYNNTLDDSVIDITNLPQVKDSLSDYSKHFFNCLSWLIANNKINIVITRPKSNRGITHTKIGLFYDNEGNIVAFEGSCNFTLTALLHNIESIAVFCSWNEGMDARIKSYQRDFEKIYNKEDSNVEYITSVDQITMAIQEAFPPKDIEDLLKGEAELLKSSLINNGLCKSSDKYKIISDAQTILNEEIVVYNRLKNRPKFPFEEPREYQKNAYKSWVQNKQKGIFAMATGTGKTITALNCLLNIFKTYDYYKAIILVPTISLVSQWKEECENFNFKNIIIVYSKSSWEEELASISLLEKIETKEERVSYIIISTYASYIRPKVFAEINKLSSNALLIADEAHNMGSPKLLEKLKLVNQKRRIGLSATPDRQYDEEGNKEINAFFGVKEQYTFEYSMSEAIAKKVLCEYFYYPHLVELEEDEMEEYIKLSAQIAQFYNSNDNSFTNSPILTALLLKRKRIIHKARNKIQVFYEIVKKRHYEKGNLKYTLVYVPEGSSVSEYCESSELLDYIGEEDQDTISLIDDYSQVLKSISEDLSVVQYTAKTVNKKSIIKNFGTGILDVITSMRCLDEGVDVPRAELAIFCASTGNPRQFIQRRGRILRQHPDKKYAYIHDLVVIPKVSSLSPSYNMERNLLKNEIKRVKNFAQLAVNTSDAILTLDDILTYYNLSLI